MTNKKEGQPKKEFDKLDINEQIKLINQALENEVMPLLASHGGGLEIMDIQGKEIYIRYQGACQGCPASGGTIDFIEQSLQSHVDEEIRVVPV